MKAWWVGLVRPKPIPYLSSGDAEQQYKSGIKMGSLAVNKRKVIDL